MEMAALRGVIDLPNPSLAGTTTAFLSLRKQKLLQEPQHIQQGPLHPAVYLLHPVYLFPAILTYSGYHRAAETEATLSTGCHWLRAHKLVDAFWTPVMHKRTRVYTAQQREKNCRSNSFKKLLKKTQRNPPASFLWFWMWGYGRLLIHSSASLKPLGHSQP
jgi:hypothetical protein